MNSTLRRFLDATDQAERDRLLEELVLDEATPIVKKTMSYRLRFCFGRSVDSLRQPDAEDLLQDVLTKLLRRLEVLRARRDPIGIRDFRQYVVRVAANACNDYLRQKFPARARLKDKLRDLLDRHPDFAIWRRDTEEEFWCGFDSWRESRPSRASVDRAHRLEVDPHAMGASLSGGVAKQRPFSGMVAELLNWIGGPIEFEALVGLMAALHGIKGNPVTGFDERQRTYRTRFQHPAIECVTRIEKRELLQEVWEAICELPAGQRQTFFLGFSDMNGDDLLSLMLDVEIGTPVEIATHLEFPLDRLIDLWKEMPLDNATLAMVLGVSRQQISKWRYRAHRRLEELVLFTRTKK